MSISQRVLVGLINVYQMIPGFWHNFCRYQPSCSDYMKEAIIIHGTWQGLKLGIKRIMRCNPWGGYGYDPVPFVIERKEKKK